MKNQGFSKRQIAEKQQIDFRTVSKYLAMTPEEFEKGVLTKERQQDLELYEGVIVDWLKQHPDMSSAQVYDWLKEHYQITVVERTARRYVGKIRKKYAIPKTKGQSRQYEAIEDPPMGQQLQVDIGEVWVYDSNNRRRIKLYFVASVLSHSRYKWGLWYTRPLTATQFVQSLQSCFEYLGGMPKELVFDQDRLLAVSENYGDIIFTQQFEQFRLASGFKVYLCRSSDPETKGRTEAVVKFFKRNYARNRQFYGIDTWNESFEDWLDRTGNAKEHGITRKVPEEVFVQERLFLKPAPSTIKMHEDIVTRTVHKDNVIFYDGNRYTVPLGTYSPGLVVSLEAEDGKLIIKDAFGDYIIAEHTLSQSKGELVKNNNHRRDNGSKLDIIYDALCKKLEGAEEAKLFLTQIRRLKPRYTRDQYALIDKTIDRHGQAAICKALNYCVTHSLFSAVEFKDAAQYFEGRMETDGTGRKPGGEAGLCEARASGTAQTVQAVNVVFLSTGASVSKKRGLAEYARIAEGGGN